MYRSGHNGAHSKCVYRATDTWVRIPPSPPQMPVNIAFAGIFISWRMPIFRSSRFMKNGQGKWFWNPLPFKPSSLLAFRAWTFRIWSTGISLQKYNLRKTFRVSCFSRVLVFISFPGTREVCVRQCQSSLHSHGRRYLCREVKMCVYVGRSAEITVAQPFLHTLKRYSARYQQATYSCTTNTETCQGDPEPQIKTRDYSRVLVGFIPDFLYNNCLCLMRYSIKNYYRFLIITYHFMDKRISIVMIMIKYPM